MNNVYIDDQGYFYSTDWSSVFIYDSEGKQVASIPWRAASTIWSS